MSNHTPDESRLPKCVTGWKPTNDPNPTLENGSVLLVALPVENSYPKGSWRYDYVVVTVACDEDYFSLLNAEGDNWYYEILDADFYAVLVQ